MKIQSIISLMREVMRDDNLHPAIVGAFEERGQPFEAGMGSQMIKVCALSEEHPDENGVVCGVPPSGCDGATFILYLNIDSAWLFFYDNEDPGTRCHMLDTLDLLNLVAQELWDRREQ